MSDRRPRAGFALIGALWLVVGISILALGAARRLESRRWLSQNLAEAAIAGTAADAGLETARVIFAATLVRGTEALGPAVDPWSGMVPYADSGSITGGRFAVAAADLESKLNVNLATEEELGRLLTALGLDAVSAQTVAQSILDWRDADDLHRPRGAEREWYEKVGSPFPPPNRDFANLDELKYVRGVSPGVYRSIRPVVTLLGDGRVNLNSAPAPVLATLPGLTARAVGLIEQKRRDGRPVRDIYELALELPSLDREVMEEALPILLLRSTFETRRVHVVSRGRAEGGRIAVDRASVFTLEGGGFYGARVANGR